MRDFDAAVLIGTSYCEIDSSGNLENNTCCCALKISTSTSCRSLRLLGKILKISRCLKPSLFQYSVLYFDGKFVFHTI